MTLSPKQQHFYDVVSSRIQYHLRQSVSGSNLKDNLRMISRILVGDNQMKPVFKRMIREEINRIRRDGPMSPDQQAKQLRLSIKKQLIDLIKQFYRQSKQQNLIEQPQKNDPEVMEINSSESKSSSQHSLNQPAVLKNEILPKSDQPQKNYQLNSQEQSYSHSSKKKTHFNHQQQNSGQISKKYQKQNAQSKEKEQASINHIPTTSKTNNNPKVKEAMINKYLTFIPKKAFIDFSEFRKTSEFGHFIYGDKINCVLDHQLTPQNQNQQMLLIDWQERRDGVQPASSMLPFSDFNYYKPLEARLFLEEIKSRQR